MLQETGERLVRKLQSRLGTQLDEAAISFADQAVEQFASSGFADAGLDDFARAAASLWRWTQTIPAGERRVRIRTDDAPPGAALLEIVQPDAPFLVASVVGEATACGCEVRGLIHPVIGRGAGGRSIIQVMIDVPVEPERLTGAIETVLDEVWAAVDDFEAMTAQLRSALEALRACGRATAEEIDFLEWLNEGRFVFLGARAYDYPDTPGPPTIREDSGLGILRDARRLVLRNANEPNVRKGQIVEAPAVVVAKSNIKSRIHRRVHMDYVGVRKFNADGAATGELRIVGLFTAEAYELPADQTPLVREKVRRVFERAGFPPGGHAAARLHNILFSWPRDDLFQIGEDELLEGALQALSVQDRPRVDLFVRRDAFDRFASVLVYIPRERFRYDLIASAGAILAKAFDGRVSAAYPEFNEAPVARLHFIIGFPEGERRSPEIDRLRRDLDALTRSWLDGVRPAAREALQGEALARVLRLAEATPADYRALNGPADFLADAEALAAVSRERVRARMFRRRGDPAERARFKIYSARNAPALSDVAPILEHMGLKAVREDGFALTRSSGDRLFVDEYLVEDAAGEPLDLGQIAGPFETAFCAVWTGATESDGFNRLIRELGVSWREAALMRALARFRQQTGLDPSQAVQEQALADNPQIARRILDLFAARFDPAADRGAEAGIWETILADLQQVPSLDADRALRRLALLVRACVRTNFYQPGADGSPRPHIAFKVASGDLADLPAPKPFREIFVYAPNVEGVHLRFGPVARGGLRWSDRRDDFRTEVLGLVKAQQVKNAVIVPVGSKGGFFPKRLPKGGSAEEVREAAVDAYKTFLFGLLDLTDNLSAEGQVMHPEGLVIHDGDDPYLVVAADKGTASFSDIANGVAESYGFWLGDAFASGGSAGYDHKEMGITARGAWEAVKRHFREMGKDIQCEPFTVIGVGDMSGDVFGNGMLLSRQIHLVAAFDHRHIFLDPDPEAEAAFAERKRLFALPRSSWDDYDRAKISAGGGVFPRSAKSIPLSPEVRRLLDVEAQEMSPGDLIRAVLKAPAELLYLGGIGTYVKAEGESHADVGDKVNDAVRIDAGELRCKVVGEGANLGFTQAGRIEYARLGGRINTDAIDNSAGVDSSDHEVNIKILTGVAERSGRLGREDRDQLLESMTKEVAAKVLAHNYSQTLALSIMQAEAVDDLESHARFIGDLEARGRLDRAVEGLPDAKAIAARAAAGEGLTRPELAVLLAYGKLTLSDDIEASKAPDDPYFAAALRRYFPSALHRFEAEMAQHRLRRDIIGTVVANEIVDRCGPTFPARLRAAAECDTTALAQAFEAARAVLDIDNLWARVSACDARAPAQGQIALYRELARVQRGQTYWLARRLAKAPDTVQALIDRYRPATLAVQAMGLTLFSDVERRAAEARLQSYKEAGAPPELSAVIAGLRPLTITANLVDLAAGQPWPIEHVACVYHQVGGAFAFDAVRAGAGALRFGDVYERTAVRRLIEDLVAEQTRVTAAVLQHAGSADLSTAKLAAQAVVRYAQERRDQVERARALVKEVAASDGGWTFAKLTIASAALKTLA